MTGDEHSAALARGWIEAWRGPDLDWLREHLAPDFVHTSPLGRLEGRDHYLGTVVPMARKSVRKLEIVGVVATADQAAIRFENHTPDGVVESCDWIHVVDGRIREIRSFYDPTLVHRSLETDDRSQFQSPE